MDTLEVIIGIGVGVLVWSLMEYLCHRFALHRRHSRGILTRQHLAHHVQSSWQRSPIQLFSCFGLVLLGAGIWFPLDWVLVDRPFAVAMTVGWAVGCLVYEAEHAGAHVGPPANRYGSWVRHHHFHHHFGHPRKNYGVTSPLWDHVFATFEKPDRVRVPRRLAMSWLVDDDGGLRPEYAQQYVLVGAPAPDTDEPTSEPNHRQARIPAAPSDRVGLT